jgi:hypothetical protein
MWWLEYSIVICFFGLCGTFFVELYLAIGQDDITASRPSTWLSFLAVVIRRFFWNIGWLYGVWPDIARWMRRAWQIICDLFFPPWLREAAEKAGTDLLAAFRALIKAPLGYFDGLWDGLCSISWIGWILVALATLAIGVVIESVAINYDMPAPFWPTWYLGFIGDAGLAIWHAFPKAWGIICRVPDGLFALAAYLKDLVPEKVYVGWLAEAERLSGPYRRLAALWGMPVFRTVLTVGGLAAAALAAYRAVGHFANASPAPFIIGIAPAAGPVVNGGDAGDDDDGHDDGQTRAVSTKRKRSIARRLEFDGSDQ